MRVYSLAGKFIPDKLLHTDKNYNPSGVQIDSKGDVWVANRTNENITLGEIEIFHKGRGVPETITESLVYPLGIVFQAKTGNAFVANAETPSGNSFTVFSPDGRFLDQIPTPFTPGYLAFHGKNGLLYITGPLSSQLGIFSASGHQIGSTITAGLDLPYGIAFDSAGDFFVANVGNSTITKYSPSGRLLCTITTTGCKK